MPEANKPHTIMLDRERVVKFDTNAICQAEEASGRAIQETLSDLYKKKTLSFRDVRALLWAGMQHEDATLTLERVGELLKPSKIPGAVAALVSALADFFGERG